MFTNRERVGNDYMTQNNSQNYIDIKFSKSNGSTKTCQAKIVGNNTSQGRKYCIYQYVVEENSFFDGSAYISTTITIRGNIVYDNAGNSNSSQTIQLRRDGALWNSSYNIDNNKIYVDTVRPNVSEAWIDIDSNYGYKQNNNNFYLKKGGFIRIKVTFTENVYDQGKSGNDYMTQNNSRNYIFVNFSKSDGSSKQCKAFIQSNNSSEGRQHCVYQYQVEEDSYFDGSAYITTSITIPENIVYDNVGNGNLSQSKELKRGGNLWNNNYNADNNKIYIDIIKPNALDAWIDVDSNFGYRKVDDNFYLKKGSQIRVGVTFNENVYDQGKSRK